MVNGMKKRKNMTPYLLIGPAVLILFFCSILPILITFGISFSDLGLAKLGKWDQMNFVGLKNYAMIFSDKVFIKSITNTLYYVVIGVPSVIVVSFLLAYLLNRGGEKKLYSFFRAVF